MPIPKYTALDRIIAACERYYERDGFVRWAAVGRDLGISRTAVLNRLQEAVKKGQLDQVAIDRWRSMSARAAHSRKNELERRANDRLRLQMTLTPENLEWIVTECETRGCRRGDLINGLIEKARTTVT